MLSNVLFWPTARLSTARQNVSACDESACDGDDLFAAWQLLTAREKFGSGEVPLMHLTVCLQKVLWGRAAYAHTRAC